MRRWNSQDAEKLYEMAHKSERKRAHQRLHASNSEKVQRILIALVKGSYVEPHFHQGSSQWEMFSLIEGRLLVRIYDVDGSEKEQYIIDHSSRDFFMVEFKPREIHSVECLSDRALILEVKEGPFDPENAKVLVSL